MNNSIQPDCHIIGALKKLQSFFRRLNIPFCITGGLAVQVRGEARFTRDIDLCVHVSFENQEDIIEAISSEFESRFSDAAEFARNNQIFPVIVGGVDVDIALGLTSFEAQAISNATSEQLSVDLSLPVVSAEDLIVFKVLAARPKDLQDLSSILARNASCLNLVYIRDTLAGFQQELDTRELLPLLDDYLSRTVATKA